MNVRAFIAIDFDESLKELLKEFQTTLKKEGVDCKWVNHDGIHITLKFLGSVEQERLKSVEAGIEKACHGVSAFDLNLKGFGAFLRKGRAGVIWVSTEKEPAFNCLYEAIEEEMAGLGFQKEERAFTPHVTLGRDFTVANRFYLEKLMDIYKDKNFGSFKVKEVVLMKSDLRPEGARYSRLAAIHLG
ncbi:MAG TPA: RNA 2',3'-cyclic phosphodiesterase [Thermodesulfovibrionia bacterium]|nr:RNA 2',3'-cyclic phosphodiesterase [Thermodesulfovibrionia bacterium]